MVITGEGLKTLDAVRGTFETFEIEPVATTSSWRRSRARRCAPDAATVKIPTQLREATGGESAVSVEGATVGAVLEALYERHAELRDRLSDGDGALRRFVNVYVDGEDIRFLDGLDTPVADGAARSRSCPPSPAAERASRRREVRKPLSADPQRG